jgi:hypothetical protein
MAVRVIKMIITLVFYILRIFYNMLVILFSHLTKGYCFIIY